MERDNDLKLLKIKLQKQEEASSFLKDMLENHTDLDSKTIHLIKVALAVQEGSDLHTEKCIEEAIHDGISIGEIKSAACFGLSKHSGSMVQELKPIMDATISKNRYTYNQSKCFWDDEY
jgi:alkylhydroperoxidase/carboxymuconolactone decarboxylase family protein YurZ